MPADKWSGSEGIDSPSDEFHDITPDSDNNLPEGTPKALYVEVAGTIVLVGKDQEVADAVSFDVAAKTYHPLRPSRVMETSTATGIKGLY